MSTSTIKATPVADWGGKTAWLTDTGDGSGLGITLFGHVITISFATARKVWHENDIIYTVPEQYRPSTNIDFVGYNGDAANVIRLKPNGEAIVWILNSSATSRIYGNVTYSFL